MDDSENLGEVVVEVGPPDNPYAKIIIPEKRKRSRDRRKLHTYIAKDLRNGVVDRRNCIPRNPLHLKRAIKDRRKTNIFVAHDRRSGIADRRNLRRYLPPLWEVVVDDSN
jgi:hypothetical protein